MDQELITYLDERFRETSRQIEGLRQETMSRFEQVDEAIRENRDEIYRTQEDVRRTQEDVRRTQEDVRRTQEDLRHTQIVVESLRSDIQGVAEGVLSTNQRIDALREEMKQDVLEVRHLIRPSYADIDKRVLSLEEWRNRVGEDPVTRVRKKS